MYTDSYILVRVYVYIYTHMCMCCILACTYLYKNNIFTYLQEEVGNANIGISILCINFFFFFVYSVFEQESNDAVTINYAVIGKNDWKI